MILLVEDLGATAILSTLRGWYTGGVDCVTTISPAGLADEDLIGCVQQQKNSIFVTHNTRDFWRRVDGRPRICIVCLDIGSDPDADTVSDVLRRVPRAGARAACKRSRLVLRVTYGRAKG